jgi:predicted nucleic acid-binding Zn ribbon protein
MNSSNQYSLKQAILELLDAYRLNDKLNETKLIHSWEKVTGKMIANHTQRLYIKNKILHVKLDSPALRNELLYSRHKIIDLLNTEAGKKVIDDISFR